MNWFSRLRNRKRARRMSIPDTPEALFEQLGETSLHVMYPHFEDLSPRHQKLLRFLHTELTKGQLTDATFLDSLSFITMIWLQFNSNAQGLNHQRIVCEPEIDTDWVRSAEHFAAMETYLTSLLAVIRLIPGGLDEHLQRPHRYVLQGPGDDY